MNEEQEPGVSGKNREGKSWINKDILKQQDEFAEEMFKIDDGYAAGGRGGNLFGRTDLSDQEGHETESLDQQKVIIALKRSPEVDISHVNVEVNGGQVILSGLVQNPKESRAMERIVENVPGVTEVIIKFDTREGDESLQKS